jgi:hypothetical protein
MIVRDGRVRPMLVGLLVGAVAVLSVGVTEARITIRPRSPLDSFYFHASYSRTPFDPASSFGLEVWNCADGTMPTLITDAVSAVLCGVGTDAATEAILAYVVELPAGACIDHGGSCYYRSSDIAGTTPGIRTLRIQYARRGRPNRVWLQSYDDLSAATQANMLLLIKADGTSRALLQDEFTPLSRGGWFSRF